jgi:hypothetical protein
MESHVYVAIATLDNSLTVPIFVRYGSIYKAKFFYIVSEKIGEKKMAAKEYRIKGSHIVIAVLLIAIVGIFAWQYYYVVPVKPLKYTTGLTVKFKIYDTATYALLDTGDVSPEFYSAGVDPIGVRTFTTKPVAVGAYFSTGGYWTVPLDAGSYTVLIKKGTTITLPEKYSVTVSGTDSEDKEVWLNPSTLNVYEKATVTITKTYIAYNATAGTYSISVASINTTKYDKWLVTLTFSVSGTDKIVKAGRIYQTKISGLVPEEYSLDGAVKTTVLEDTEASDDGMTGYYNEFAEWTGGEMHRLDLYFNDYGVTGISGTITVKLFQYYACKNTVLRTHWTDETTTLTVVA